MFLYWVGFFPPSLFVVYSFKILQPRKHILTWPLQCFSWCLSHSRPSTKLNWRPKSQHLGSVKMERADLIPEALPVRGKHFLLGVSSTCMTSSAASETWRSEGVVCGELPQSIPRQTLSQSIKDTLKESDKSNYTDPNMHSQLNPLNS